MANFYWELHERATWWLQASELQPFSSALPPTAVRMPAEHGGPLREREPSDQRLRLFPEGAQVFPDLCSRPCAGSEGSSRATRRRRVLLSPSPPILRWCGSCHWFQLQKKQSSWATRNSAEPAGLSGSDTGAPQEVQQGNKRRSPGIYAPFMVSRTKQDSSWKFCIIWKKPGKPAQAAFQHSGSAPQP